jgi:deoxyribonuclease (pyrimidine dimer)
MIDDKLIYHFVMTRINLVPVSELSNQHLMAEYRELPRIPNSIRIGKARVKDIPEKFTLGKGHVKFFYNKLGFLKIRHRKIFVELVRREYNIKTLYNGLFDNLPIELMNDYIPETCDIEVSRKRIQDKINENPGFYKFFR